MHIKRTFFSLSLLIAVFHLRAQVETITNKYWLNVNLNNGLTALFKPIENESSTEITFWFKTGSAYETDSLLGISHLLQIIKAAKVSDFIEQNKNNPALQNIHFTSHSTTEHAIYKFIVQPQQAQTCFQIMRDLVFSGYISEEQLSAAKNKALQEIEEQNRSANSIFENELLKRVFRKDYKKLNVIGDSSTLPNIKPLIIRGYAAKYYVPNNVIATITGNFRSETLQHAFETVLSDLVHGEFDPETITRMIRYRPMIFRSQFVMEDSTKNPEFHICWQFPGVNVNERASYSAFLLTTILNDPNNHIQSKARKMGCRKLLMQYDANNFSGVFRVILQPDKSNFYQVYTFLLNELGRLDKTIANESMMYAGKIQFRNRYNVLTTTKYYSEESARYMVYKDENYYQELADSIFSITEQSFKLFIRDYVNASPHVSALRISENDRQSIGVDSVFAEIDENVNDYVFRYRRNVTDLEGAENETMLRNLLQWLRINEDVSIQVNGFSDESEYNRFKNDTIFQFIDSLPTFAKSKTDLVKKGYVRPDLMRALKVVKYLYDNGIKPERLSGTGMKFSSDDDEETLENMKCTLTVNKQHQGQTLYEKYYGRKKE